MKKLSILILFGLLFTGAKAQSETFGFAQFHVNSIGGGMAAGIQSGHAILTLGMNHPLRSTENPDLYYMTAGYVYGDKYNISLQTGGAYSKRKDFKTNIDGNQVNEFIPVVNLEIGADFYSGRVFTNLSYANKLFFGIGIKAKF